MALRPNYRTSSARWIKLLAWTSLALVVLAVCGLVAVKMWVNSYLRSAEFRKQIGERCGYLLDVLRLRAEF